MRISSGRIAGLTLPRLGRAPLVAAGALLAAFAVLTLLVGQRIAEPVDLALLRFVQSWQSPALDLLAGVLNYVAAGEVVLAVTATASLWLLRRGVSPVAAAAPLAFLVVLPLELLLKLTLDQPVPEQFYRQTVPYGLLTLKTLQSYPSGHALRSAFIAVLFSYLAGRMLAPRQGLAVALAVLGALFVILGAWCRVYQGQHWPTDVVGGGLLGAATACFSVALLGPVRLRST